MATKKQVPLNQGSTPVLSSVMGKAPAKKKATTPVIPYQKGGK